MSKRYRLLLVGVEVLTPLCIVGLWWVWSADGENFFAPPLSQILAEFQELWLFERIPNDVLPSLRRLTIGYLTAIAVGLPLGLLLGMVSTIRHVVWPIVDFLRSIPPTALIPFAILVMGVGDDMKIAIIALTCLFPILLNTVNGVASVDPLLIDTAKSYGMSPMERARRIVFPAALPSAVAGMRISLPIALILMVVSEMVASSNGLGYFVVQAQRSFAIPEMWSGILLIGLLGYLMNAAFMWVERRIIGWHYRSKSSAQ